MDTLISLIGAPANALTLLIACGVLFFQLVDRGLLKIGKNMSLGSRMDSLTQYANHETTKRLDDLIAMEKKEHEEYDQMREIMREVHAMLKEFKEYGIKLRK